MIFYFIDPAKEQCLKKEFPEEFNEFLLKREQSEQTRLSLAKDYKDLQMEKDKIPKEVMKRISFLEEKIRKTHYLYQENTDLLLLAERKLGRLDNQNRHNNRHNLKPVKCNGHCEMRSSKNYCLKK